MYKKFLSCVLVSLLLTTIPSWGVQRFILSDDELGGITITKNNKSKQTKTNPGQLKWNQQLYNPIRCLDLPNHTEWVIAPNHSRGPEIMRGQDVEIEMFATWITKPWDDLTCFQQVGSVVLMAAIPICIPCYYCAMCQDTSETTPHTPYGQININTQPKTLRITMNQGNKTFTLSDGD
jgi:hypothetical protein